MSVRNISFHSDLNPGNLVIEPTVFPGCLDPDLAVGPGRFNRRGRAAVLSHKPDRSANMIKTGLLSMEPAACRLLEIHSKVEPVLDFV